MHATISTARKAPKLTNMVHTSTEDFIPSELSSTRHADTRHVAMASSNQLENSDMITNIIIDSHHHSQNSTNGANKPLQQSHTRRPLESEMHSPAHRGMRHTLCHGQMPDFHDIVCPCCRRTTKVSRHSSMMRCGFCEHAMEVKHKSYIPLC
ncbi:hypothetical protein J8273_2467 [Carpediemonas membranifera]|uniref:Uncharacterized protein n=1 Tax=Carpediemonas membranifera TaxID=201153 RepID=A0A8J6EB33_9EUKA|nr:hypothetical protein J8273_2467 [Carpediemonas membranifera]|eukprot:KAG9396115.1 hypothetical protein J8273_2467 [Carpediemonas membranifera]